MQNVSKECVNTNWLRWCRLCAKREDNGKKNESIFVKNAAGKYESELATSIGKYFWVNIKPNDLLSQCLCSECKQLVQELVAFTERINKVQTLFCLLQNRDPTTAEQYDRLRIQCGLVDDGWKHLIRTESPALVEPEKVILIDKEIQTNFECFQDSEIENQKIIETSVEAEDIINMLQKPDIEVDAESEHEIVAENVYEYVVHSETDVEFFEGEEYVVPASNDQHEDQEFIPESAGVETVVHDSDIFKELQFQTTNEGKDEDNQAEIFEIIAKDEMDYEESSPSAQQYDDEDEEEIEVLDEDDGEEDYIVTVDGQAEANATELALQKVKRGRPFGAKNSETETSLYRFECKECKRTYKSSTIFRRHMLSLHNISVDDLPEFKSKSNTCAICNKQFVTRSSLKIHMRHHLPHEEKYNVPCPYCGRKFSQVGAMRQHVNGIHHQIKPYICDQCGRACKTMGALNEHQLVHTNECPFECEVCHKSFKNKARLKFHMDTHNKSFYKCPDCGLNLNTKRTLMQHRLVHSDVKRFKCEFCDAAFKRSKALKTHLILHSGLRPYKCNFCDKSFSNGSNCRAHKKRTHPRELAEGEANGIEPERAPIPKMEELKSAKGILVQPRKMKRHAGGLPHRLRKLLSAEKCSEENSNDCGDSAENYESLSGFHYEISKSEEYESQSVVENTTEQCEETVIYEIIDEI